MPAAPHLRSVLEAGLDLLFPPRCVACGRFGEPLCAPCAAGLPPATGEGRCPNCAAAWDGPLNCPRCLGWVLEGASAAFEMDGPARRVVHGLKYRRVRPLVPLMARHMQPLRTLRSFDVAYAVPLHRSRVRDRGFNQAELLLAELQWPAGPGTLARVRRTPTQVGQHLQERRRNVDGAFAYEGPPLSGLRVALLDDVITSGATVNECARVLLDAGARAVVAFAFARASYDPGDTTRAPLD
ncbi:MAG: double zinc ribbon domain-containing protein [Hyphomicrobiales bacterium]